MKNILIYFGSNLSIEIMSYLKDMNYCNSNYQIFVYEKNKKYLKKNELLQIYKEVKFLKKESEIYSLKNMQCIIASGDPSLRYTTFKKLKLKIIWLVLPV